MGISYPPQAQGGVASEEVNALIEAYISEQKGVAGGLASLTQLFGNVIGDQPGFARTENLNGVSYARHNPSLQICLQRLNLEYRSSGTLEILWTFPRAFAEQLGTTKPDHMKVFVAAHGAFNSLNVDHFYCHSFSANWARLRAHGSFDSRYDLEVSVAAIGEIEP